MYAREPPVLGASSKSISPEECGSRGAGLFPCEYVPEVPAPAGTVPHHLPGTNPNLQEYLDWYAVPAEALA